MRKVSLILLACFAMAQSSYASTSALSESLLEYEAITTAIGTNPSFENVIGPNEFIIDIKRITKHVNVTGEVRYKIITKTPEVDSSAIIVQLPDTNNINASDCCCRRHRHQHNQTSYIAVLNIEPNPEIGPFIITVVSITPTHTQTHLYFDNELALEADSLE